jgi:hypothetical protein
MHPNVILLRHRQTHPLEALARDWTMSGGAVAAKESAGTQIMTLYTDAKISQTMFPKWF